MKNKVKILSVALAAALSMGMFTGCQKATTSGTSSSSKTENLSLYLFGSEAVANKTVLEKINAKLKKDVNATLTVKYIDWNDISTKYPLLFASGEQFDMAYTSCNNSPAYSTLATQGSLADISQYLDSVPTLKSTISDTSWNQMKVDGKIYGVPSNYTEFTPYGFAYSENLVKKYNLSEITSISTMEAYMDAVVKNEKYVPLNGSSNLAEDLYRMFIDTTDQWIYAPGISNSDFYLATKSASGYKTVFSPIFTQEFEDWAVKMKEWANKGYWEKDILSSQKDDKDNFINGQGGAFITHMSDWSGNYGTIKTSLPDITTNFWTFSESAGKIEKTAGVQNVTSISKNCSDPEKALKVIEKLMTDQSYYDLLQYGISGTQYEIKDNAITTPSSYNKDTDAFGFSGWALRNDKYNIRSVSEDTRRYELNEKWNKTAIDNPYASFNFDSTNISNEISSITNVNSTLGIQILLGKESGDAKTAVAKYRQQLKSAGIDKVISEVNSQLSGYTAVN
jgi:putative aldouronate transport system substrate-binding protein